jgi:outer membrane lipoprotein-sorting protein
MQKQLKPILKSMLFRYWTLVMASTLAFQAAAAEPSGEEIIKQSLDNYYYGGKDQRVQVDMKLINAQGSTRERSLTMLRLNVGNSGDQKYYIFFHSPADVKGTAFLVWKYPRAEDDRWIYIPAIKLVKRIAADDTRSSFVGSDFTYEDVSGRDVTDETHQLLKREDLNGRPTFLIESKPKAPMDYTRRVVWVDSERWLPLKEEYYDNQDQLMRTFSADKVEQINSVWTVTERTMKNIKSSHRTEVRLSNVEYDVGLSEDIFTERYLRTPPPKWVR